MGGIRPSRLGSVGAGLFLLLLPTRASAHRMDEYLQAALVGIGPDSVSLDLALTPGSGVAEGVVRLLDADGDGQLSEAECREYAVGVARDLEVELEGRRLLSPDPVFEFAELESMREGTGTSRIVWTFKPTPMKPGVHRLVFRNRHLSGASVYLANALKPESPEVTILEQSRSTNQSELTVRFELSDFRQTSPGTPLRRRWSRLLLLTLSGLALLFVARRARFR
jgi:hypothetical protein